MSRLCVYYIRPRQKKKWIEGDQYIIEWVKRLLGKKGRTSSLELVFLSLCRGLGMLKVDYVKNLPFDRLKPDDIVIMLGHGKNCLKDYNKPNPVIAGISLMSHPSEWPDLFEKYPVKVYLQHSEWTVNIYKKYYGDRCDIWPTGIDTEKWQPDATEKDIDVLLYDKIMIGMDKTETLLKPIRNFLEGRSLKIGYIRYGAYQPEEFLCLLKRAKSMVFMVEHESQGIACEEAMAMNVPIFAWDQGKWLDPSVTQWGEKDTPASSVPYFDDRCGR